jgi:hypothetical protein
MHRLRARFAGFQFLLRERAALFASIASLNLAAMAA